jgi:hypothetical protein
MPPEVVVADAQPAEPHAHVLPEPPAVDARRLAVAVCAALALLAVAVVGLGALYWREVPAKTMPPPQTFPQPRVQADETTELRLILARQRALLSGYRWANPEHTLVQIPIERAMTIISDEGAHAYDPIAPSPSALASPEAGAQRAMTPAPATPQSGAPSQGSATEKSP